MIQFIQITPLHGRRFNKLIAYTVAVQAALPCRLQRSSELARDVKWNAAGIAKYPL